MTELDEFIEESCKMIGKEDTEVESANTDVDLLALKNFYRALGNNNPLYTDPNYATNTKYGCLTAPPTFVASIRYPASKGAFSKKDYSLANFMSGTTFEWFDVIRNGEKFTTELKLKEVYQKKSWKGRQAGVLVSEALYWNTYGGLIAAVTGTETMIPFKRGEEMFVEREMYRYSGEEIKKIEHDIDSEVVRGYKPLYWEEVNEGDKLTPVVKGPLDLMFMVPWLIATSPYIPLGELRYFKVKEKPGWKRLHPLMNWPYWDGDLVPEDLSSCKVYGMSLPYARGILRTSLAGELLTNWMSDEGFLRRLSVEVDPLKPQLYGDTVWIKGEITHKYKEKICGVLYYAVDVKIEGVNQLMELGTTGTATVYLPSRGAQVSLPIPKECENT